MPEGDEQEHPLRGMRVCRDRSNDDEIPGAMCRAKILHVGQTKRQVVGAFCRTRKNMNDMNDHKMIRLILEQMESSIYTASRDGEMPQEWEFMYDTEDNSVTALLTHDVDGIYIVNSVQTDSQWDRKHPRIEEALEGKILDLSDLYKDMEERKADAEALERDPYDYYGVSRWDFL